MFGRVAGDEAASYLLQQVSSTQTATARLNQVNQHLATTIRIDPESKKVFLEFSWDQQPGGAVTVSSGQVQPQQQQQQITEKKQTKAAVTHNEDKVEKKEFTLAEVAKHTTKDDVWVCRFLLSCIRSSTGREPRC